MVISPTLHISAWLEMKFGTQSAVIIPNVTSVSHLCHFCW